MITWCRTWTSESISIQSHQSQQLSCSRRSSRTIFPSRSLNSRTRSSPTHLISQFFTDETISWSILNGQKGCKPQTNSISVMVNEVATLLESFLSAKGEVFWLIDLLHTAGLGTQNWRREEFGRTFCKMRSCPLVSYLPWCSWLFRASAFPNTWSLN